MLESITEEKYNSMFAYYKEIKHLFTIEGMTNKIIQENIN
jgi:hemoglobin-like flavoprotein